MDEKRYKHSVVFLGLSTPEFRAASRLHFYGFCRSLKVTVHGRVFLTRVSLKAPVNTPDKYVNTLNRTYTLQLCVVPCFFFFIIIITDEGPLSTNMYCELCQTRKLRREFPSAAITHKCEHAPLHCLRVSALTL